MIGRSSDEILVCCIELAVLQAMFHVTDPVEEILKIGQINERLR